MGMKSASIWFSNKWQVRSTAIDENMKDCSFCLETVQDKEESGLDVANRQVPERNTELKLNLKM